MCMVFDNNYVYIPVISTGFVVVVASEDFLIRNKSHMYKVAFIELLTAPSLHKEGRLGMRLTTPSCKN